MNKNKINFRLVNFTILILAIFLIYSVKGLWMGAIDKILAILFPFLISFAIAYALYPFLKTNGKRITKMVISPNCQSIIIWFIYLIDNPSNPPSV